jgi:Arc/MetJ family transcription regulator
MQQCVFMRTTIDLPDELLKQAKIAAVERGLTLRDLVGGALVRELGRQAPDRAAGRRARFPVFRSRRPGALGMTARELSDLEADEEARRNGLGA